MSVVVFFFFALLVGLPPSSQIIMGLIYLLFNEGPALGWLVSR